MENRGYFWVLDNIDLLVDWLLWIFRIFICWLLLLLKEFLDVVREQAIDAVELPVVQTQLWELELLDHLLLLKES